MEKLYGLKEIMERYRCKDRTARTIMREMGTVTSRPMLVTESAILRWEAKRQQPAEEEKRRAQRKQMLAIVPAPPKAGQRISRTRPESLKAVR